MLIRPIDFIIHTHSYGRPWVCSLRDQSILLVPRCSNWYLLLTAASRWPHILHLRLHIHFQSSLIGRKAVIGWSKCKSDEATFSTSACEIGVARRLPVWCQIRNDRRCACDSKCRAAAPYSHRLWHTYRRSAALEMSCNLFESFRFDALYHLDERAIPVRIRTGSTLSTKARRLFLRRIQCSIVQIFIITDAASWRQNIRC